LKHAATECKRRLDLIWIEAAHLEKGSDSDFDQNKYDTAWDKLRKADGVVVPGGFGKRYFEQLSVSMTLKQCSNFYSYVNKGAFWAKLWQQNTAVKVMCRI